jgi:hypothetical protein
MISYICIPSLNPQLIFYISKGIPLAFTYIQTHIYMHTYINPSPYICTYTYENINTDNLLPSLNPQLIFCISKDIHKCTEKNGNIYIYLQIWIQIRTRTFPLCTNAYIYIYIYKYIYMYIYIRPLTLFESPTDLLYLKRHSSDLHTHIYKHIYTYIHTHIQRFPHIFT